MQNSYNLAGPKPVKQALAAAIYGDKSVFYKCGFVGFQDTLFDARGRHYFKDCYIQGEVDFIFGSGQSYYEVVYKYKFSLSFHSIFSSFLIEFPVHEMMKHLF